MFVLLLVAELRDDLAARKRRVFTSPATAPVLASATRQPRTKAASSRESSRNEKDVESGLGFEPRSEGSPRSRSRDAASTSRVSGGCRRGGPRGVGATGGFGGVEDRLLRGGEGGGGFHLGGRAGDDLVDGGEGAGDEGGRIDIVARRRRRRIVGVGGANVCFPRRTRRRRRRGTRRGYGGAARRETRASDARGRGRHHRQGAAPFATSPRALSRPRGGPEKRTVGDCPGAAARRERRAAHV